MVWFVFGFLCAISSALGSVVEKKTLIKEHAMEFCVVLAIFNLLLSLPLLLKVDSFALTPLVLAWAIVIAVIDTFSFLLITKAIRHMEISVASPFLTFGPIFSLIIAFFFLGETLSWKQIGGLMFIVVGAYTLEISKKHDLWEPFRIIKESKYIHYIFLALVLYGFSSTIGRYLMNTEYSHAVSPFLFLPLMHFFIAINFLILISLFHDGLKGVQHGFKNAGKWIFCVSIFIVAARAFWFVALALPMAKVGLLQAIKRTSALFSTIIGGELFHEKNLFHKIVACIIMLIGVYFIII